MESLRAELLEAQKVRSDLLKWKLLIIASVVSVSLGFSGDSPGNAHLALAVLPLVCFYVDLCCRHLSLRNKAIGLFIRWGNHQCEDLREYEEFYATVSQQVWKNFSLESVALLGLTLFVSAAVIPLGILAGSHSWQPFQWPAGLFYLAGVLGILSTLILQTWYMKQRKNMDHIIADKTVETVAKGP